MFEFDLRLGPHCSFALCFETLPSSSVVQTLAEIHDYFGVVSFCRFDLDRVLNGGQDCDVQSVILRIVNHNVEFTVASMVPTVCTLPRLTCRRCGARSSLLPSPLF